LQGAAPATIKLWYVDEQTGLWKEEGEATKTGNNYVGEVKHFTYWNCDVSGATVNLTATFVTSDGVPFVYGSINIKPVSGYSGAAHGYTDSLGQINGPVPANMNLVLQVVGPCNNVIYSQNIGPYSAAVNLGTITIPSTTVSLVTIKGKLLNCSNAVVTNGYALIYYDYITRYVSVNSNGEFSTSFSNCTASPLTCEITGIDATAQQQSTPVNVTITSPVTNAGNIVACGTSTIQYINYTLDAVNYSISDINAGADSLYAYTNQQGTTAPFRVSIGGGGLPGDHISFSFTSTATAGTYPMSELGVQTHTNVSLVTPFNVTVTNFPQARGEYYEGNFSGQFTDIATPVPVHTISCSFRLRRN
jgi:hypothetical protein